MNFRAFAKAAGAATEILAVVKANAYGHGAEVCSAMLARAGARWLGVTCSNEGMRVRQALDAVEFMRGGDESTPEILVMCGFLSDEVAMLQEHALTPVVWNLEQISWLQSSSGMKVHVEVDTGMGRQGVEPGQALEELLNEIASSRLSLDGIFTHFCESESAHSELTQTQEQRFEAAIAQVRAKELKPSWVHAGNSSTVDNPAQPWPWLVQLAESVGAHAMVRSGLALYGYSLPIDGADSSLVQPQVRPALRPVMQWKTRVLAIRDLAAGDTVGYGATFTAPAPMRVALLPVGYADGLRRELSSTNSKPGGWVMIADHRAAILGRISMNLTVVDVTGIDGVAAGDEVVLLGDGVTAEDHAQLAATIPYEILCGVRER